MWQGIADERESYPRMSVLSTQTADKTDCMIVINWVLHHSLQKYWSKCYKLCILSPFWPCTAGKCSNNPFDPMFSVIFGRKGSIPLNSDLLRTTYCIRRRSSTLGTVDLKPYYIRFISGWRQNEFLDAGRYKSGFGTNFFLGFWSISGFCPSLPGFWHEIARVWEWYVLEHLGFLPEFARVLTRDCTRLRMRVMSNNNPK
jgi:hypothetical protein